MTFSELLQSLIDKVHFDGYNYDPHDLANSPIPEDIKLEMFLGNLKEVIYRTYLNPRQKEALLDFLHKDLWDFAGKLGYSGKSLLTGKNIQLANHMNDEFASSLGAMEETLRGVSNLAHECRSLNYDAQRVLTKVQELKAEAKENGMEQIIGFDY
jgi:hypothetical protein